MDKINEIEAKIKQKRKELEKIKGKPCEVYSRIVGYYRPVKNFNKGQAAQYKKRKKYDIDKKEIIDYINEEVNNEDRK